jgi:transposase
MSRYRLLPTPAQHAVLRDHCGHARYVWNLALEQHQHWHPGRTSAPGYLEQCRQLTAARAEHPWLRRARVRLAMARLQARETDRRKDWAEKASTDLARRFDLIRVEDLQIQHMTRAAKGTRENPGQNVRQKAGLNRGILRSGWGLLVRRLEQKAPAGWRGSDLRSPASGARRAGMWTRTRVRVKRGSRARPAGTPGTLM